MLGGADLARTGRWFYTCQKPETQRCDFFLWEDDAKPREEAAVLNNSRSEPQAAPASDAPKPASGMRPPSPPQQHAKPSTASTTTMDHADSETEGEEEELVPWPSTVVETNHPVRRPHAVSPPPITPKKSVTTNGLATPITGKRTADDLSEWDAAGIPFPPPSKRLNTGGTTPQTTPTPSRCKDALAPSDPNIDLNTEVMNVLNLHNFRLDNSTRGDLEDVLQRITLRVQGIARGRDVSRLQIKAKDAKITEQQLRITTLEAELEAERAMVHHLRWERENGQAG